MSYKLGMIAFTAFHRLTFWLYLLYGTAVLFLFSILGPYAFDDTSSPFNWKTHDSVSGYFITYGGVGAFGMAGVTYCSENMLLYSDNLAFRKQYGLFQVSLWTTCLVVELYYAFVDHVKMTFIGIVQIFVNTIILALAVCMYNEVSGFWAGIKVADT